MPFSLETRISQYKRPNFFSWYFNHGTRELFRIWADFFLFFLDFFSLREMAFTLFYPWRRDVSRQHWRGFHPFRSTELLIENLFSRIIGAFVRLVVILVGLVFLFLCLLAGMLAAFAWIGAIFIFAMLIILLIKGTISLIAVFIPLVIWVIISVLTYYEDTKDEISAEKLSLLPPQIVRRVALRLGITDEKIVKTAFENKMALQEFLKSINLSGQQLLRIADWEIGSFNKKQEAEKFWVKENLNKIRPIGLDWRYGYTINLDRFCNDITKHDSSDYANAQLIGRDNEYEILKLLLERPDQNCALIVANSGVGKKTLVHTLARKIRERAESNLERKRILLVDLGSIISRAISNGEDVEEVLRNFFTEAANAGNIIMVFENLDNFLGKQESSFHPDVSAVLSEFLPYQSFQIIATATTKEYHKLIESKDQITKFFEVIELREPSEQDSMQIILNQVERYEKKGVIFTFKALQEIISESGRYKFDVSLPERALDLTMDVLTYWEKRSEEYLLTENTVADYLTLKTGVKHGVIEGEEQKKLLDLENQLHKQVIGQEEAINQVADALRRARSGIGDTGRPIGSFLFLGPTGVGKTETAKAIAKTYFGDEGHMIRLDMSEFQNPNSIDRLLGSSELNQQGRLITQIKDNPCTLLLLDELEKAYPDLLDIFLQILDEGYVTDAFGEKINFSNAIIIATSNAGAALIKRMTDQKNKPEEIKQAVIDYAIEKNVFKPEFLNRFDGVIFFRPLNDNELAGVAKMQLKKFIRKMLKEKNIDLEIDDRFIEKILSKGYNPIFGARSLNRFIEEEIESAVAKKIISGEVKPGEKIRLTPQE